MIKFVRIFFALLLFALNAFAMNDDPFRWDDEKGDEDTPELLSEEKAQDLLISASNDATARYKLAGYILDGKAGFKQNNEFGLSLLIESALSDNEDALFKLGLAYEFGHYGLEIDLARALECFQKASELGCIFSPIKISELGTNNFSNEPLALGFRTPSGETLPATTTLDALRRKHEHGDLSATYELAKLFDAKKNWLDAIFYYLLLVRNDYPEARKELLALFTKLETLSSNAVVARPQNRELVQHNLLQRAEAGDTEAMYQVALMYEGKGSFLAAYSIYEQLLAINHLPRICTKNMLFRRAALMMEKTGYLKHATDYYVKLSNLGDDVFDDFVRVIDKVITINDCSTIQFMAVLIQQIALALEQKEADNITNYKKSFLYLQTLKNTGFDTIKNCNRLRLKISALEKKKRAEIALASKTTTIKEPEPEIAASTKSKNKRKKRRNNIKSNNALSQSQAKINEQKTRDTCEEVILTPASSTPATRFMSSNIELGPLLAHVDPSSLASYAELAKSIPYKHHVWDVAGPQMTLFKDGDKQIIVVVNPDNSSFVHVYHPDYIDLDYAINQRLSYLNNLVNILSQYNISFEPLAELSQSQSFGNTLVFEYGGATGQNIQRELEEKINLEEAKLLSLGFLKNNFGVWERPLEK